MAVSQKIVNSYVMLIKNKRRTLEDIPFEDVRTAVAEVLKAESNKE